MLFSDGRVDIIEALPADSRTFAEFIDSAMELLALNPQREVKWNRLAVVQEYIFNHMTREEEIEKTKKMVPQADPESMEWSVRWNDGVKEEDESYHLITEVAMVQGMVVLSGRAEQIRGVKVLQDISTSSENQVLRFDLSNCQPIWESLFEKLDERNRNLPIGG
jgi:hypothetical protein